MKILTLSILSLLIFSCSSTLPVNMSVLGLLKKDHHLDSLISDNKEYGLDYEIKRKVEIPNFKDSNYTIVISIYEMEISFIDNKYTYTALAFENKRLIFYGFPEDYFKSRSKKINYLGEKIHEEIEKIEL